MKQTELFLTVEQCRHLQELGLDMSDAVVAWYPAQIDVTDDGFPVVSEKVFSLYANENDAYSVPAYTLDEVLGKLPDELEAENYPYLNIDFGNTGLISYEELTFGNSTYSLIYFSIEENGRLGAAYQMLCWVLENGYLKKEVKK